MTREDVREDDKQYKEFKCKFKQLSSSDYATAFELSQEAWELADRWNEIHIQAGQFISEVDITKSDFQKWAYARYRQLHLAHEQCRMVWNKGENFMRENRRG